MGKEIKVPAVGESITSGVLSAWHKKSGEFVQDGEPLFALETDKISTDVPAPAAGKVSIQVEAGQEVKIGQIVGSIDESAKAEAADEAPKKQEPPNQPSAQRAAVEKPSSQETAPLPETGKKPDQDRTERNRALSPAARRLATEKNVSVDQLTGTGKRGQVTKSDIVERLGQRQEPPSVAPVAPTASESPVPSADQSAAAQVSDRSNRVVRRKMSPLRRKIAAQLVMAQQTAAMLTTFNECDMSAVIALRAKFQDSFQKRHGTKLGFMSFFVKAVVDALVAVPAINARLDGDDLVENKFYDIGVALGTERGLVVPVIRNADRKDFAQIEKDVAAFAVKARDGKLQLDDLTGGVFTITNGGIYGSLLSTPILNPPQSGILGMHKIQSRPMAVEDRVEVRPMMYLALSYDHRVVDGKEAVGFLVRVKECIEDPSRLLLAS
jgi:2-oxoglutarate dehydrogenase E2 component (dihydrolipoamide succinyltransferase)